MAGTNVIRFYREPIVWLVLIVLLANAGYAFSGGGAALQVSSYETVPSTIYPGTTGTLQLSIQNTGSATASPVTIYYSLPGVSGTSSTSPGDIGPSSTAIVSVPFSIPDTASGVYVIPVNIYYEGGNDSSSIKSTPFSISLLVAQHQVLEVKTRSIKPGVALPGDKITAYLTLVNTGGVVNNVVITPSDNSSFNLDGTTQLTAGNVPRGSEKNISVPLVLSSTASKGKYSIPLTVSYQDSLQTTKSQTVKIGPVVVSDFSGQFRIYLDSLNPVEVGSEAKFALTLENIGTSDTSAAVTINQTSVFTPIGVSRIYFDDIPAGDNLTETMILGIEPTTTAGYYKIQLGIESNGNTYAQDVGLVVTATPELEISAETSPQLITTSSQTAKVTVHISNSGNSAVRSVYVKAGSTKDLPLSGTTDKFIGTLNVDDYSTLQVTAIIPTRLAPGDYQLPVTVTFKDTKNGLHTVNKSVDISVYSDSGSASFGAANSADSSAAGPSATTTGAGIRRPGNGGFFGLGLLQWGIVIAVVAVVGYFGYKKWKEMKDKEKGAKTEAKK